jgi:hypothetical protein
MDPYTKKKCYVCNQFLPVESFQQLSLFDEFYICRSCELDTLKRECGTCGKEKLLREFKSDHNRPYGKAYVCKDCHAERGRKNHLHNVGELYEYLKGKSCDSCGESNPLRLTFDHQYDKKENVSDMVRRYCWSTVLKEIEKCKILCANCHMEKTAEERGTHMYNLMQEEENNGQDT